MRRLGVKGQGTRDPRQADWLSVLRGAEAAQLVEFALVMPLLVVLVVGAIDFGTGWVLKDRMANAARDGARVAVSLPNDTFNPQCGGTPCSVQSAASAAVNYLANAGLSACGLDPSSTAPTNGPGTYGWTYTSGNCPGTTRNMSIVVERAVTTTVTVGTTTTTVLMTRVTVNYPLKWMFGSVIKLLVPSSNYASTLTLTTQEIMQNES
jgi:Flp pilus assembly protein TadG